MAATETGLPVTSLPPGPTKTDVAPMQAGIADTQPVPVPSDAWLPQIVDAAPPAETSRPTSEAPRANVEPVQQQPLAREQPARDIASSAVHAEPAPPQVQVPPITLTLPENSGLEMVETKHHAPVEQDSQADAPRPRRVRPPRVTVAEEPLQMVETRQDQPPGVP